MFLDFPACYVEYNICNANGNFCSDKNNCMFWEESPKFIMHLLSDGSRYKGVCFFVRKYRFNVGMNQHIDHEFPFFVVVLLD